MAIANTGTNGVAESVTVELADAADLTTTEAQVALVNVTLETHRLIAPTLTDVPLIVISGVLTDQLDAATATYGSHRPARVFSYGEWTAAELRRSTDE